MSIFWTAASSAGLSAPNVVIAMASRQSSERIVQLRAFPLRCAASRLQTQLQRQQHQQNIRLMNLHRCFPLVTHRNSVIKFLGLVSLSREQLLWTTGVASHHVESF